MDKRLLQRVLVTDRKRSFPDDLRDVVARAVDLFGVTMVIVREPDLSPDLQVELAQALIAAVDVPVLMSRDPDLAARAQCAGVQLGWGSPTVARARAALGADAIIGSSVHSAVEGIAAANAGADYLLLGPIRDTPKARGPVISIGIAPLRELARATRVPVVAIGGMTASDESEIRGAGGAGIAAIRAFVKDAP